jgi:uncharacterized phage protein (TIGR01671 family)
MLKWNDEKFKVWDGTKIWKNKVSIVNGIDEMFCGDVDDLIFLRSTEVFDKNNEEIFEGDIVHDTRFSEDFNFVVVFENRCFKWKQINPALRRLENSTWEILCKHFVIIGNVFENPEKGKINV